MALSVVLSVPNTKGRSSAVNPGSSASAFATASITSEPVGFAFFSISSMRVHPSAFVTNRLFSGET